MDTWIQIRPFSRSPSLDFLPVSVQPHPLFSPPHPSIPFSPPFILVPPPLHVTSWLFSALYPVLSTASRPPKSCCLVTTAIRGFHSIYDQFICPTSSYRFIVLIKIASYVCNWTELVLNQHFESLWSYWCFDSFHLSKAKHVVLWDY